MQEHVRVSVIVPTWNPGSAIDELVRSLDRQTLPTDRFEVLLCDDGSDEPTRAQLAAIARERPHVRVLNLPHSGWPGTPRNRGVDAAAGTYVYFVDQDDRLFDRALESLCDFADRHGSDVVVGREVGIGRRIPRSVFRRDVPHAVLGEDPLLALLTPHKLFRTAFLRTEGIRFPDGRVRLEDHLFVMQAYFAARTISILASEPCYGWRKQKGSASSSRIEPETYFPHLEAVLDLVEAHTEPGALRDRLLSHWYRGKILQRLSGRRMVKYPDDYRRRLLDVVVPIAQQRFGPGVERRLAFPHRVRSQLLRADRREDLRELAEFESRLSAHARVESAKWSRGGGLHLAVRVDVAGSEAGGAEAPTPAGSPSWLLPRSVADVVETWPDAGRSRARQSRLEIRVRDEESQIERRIAETRPADDGTVRVSLDPLKIFARHDHGRLVTLTALIRHGGWSFEVPLTAEPAVISSTAPSPLLAGRRITVASTPQGAVELRREWPRGALKDFAARGVRRVRRALRRTRRR